MALIRPQVERIWGQLPTLRRAHTETELQDDDSILKETDTYERLVPYSVHYRVIGYFDFSIKATASLF